MEYFNIYGNIVSKDSISITIQHHLETIRDEIKGRKIKINRSQVCRMLQVISLLQEKINQDPSVVMTAGLFQPTLFMGYCTITGEHLQLDAETLNKIMNVATNMEIYPNSDGTITVDFSFKSLAYLQTI